MCENWIVTFWQCQLTSFMGHTSVCCMQRKRCTKRLTSRDSFQHPITLQKTPRQELKTRKGWWAPELRLISLRRSALFPLDANGYRHSSAKQTDATPICLSVYVMDWVRLIEDRKSVV